MLELQSVYKKISSYNVYYLTHPMRSDSYCNILLAFDTLKIKTKFYFQCSVVKPAER